MGSLPTGTVTFLFTDIEGSTRLLEQLKDAYANVLAECRQLVRTAVQERGGEEVDTEGDAVFAAFPSARGALLAAVTAQQRILRYPWPGGTAVLVRMGLHTGEARVAEGGYVGMDVHRAARICAAGHGGQILVSDTVSALVAKDLPDEVSLRDLGEQRLKDLTHPHRLFQVLAPDLPADFPRVRSLDAHRNNLPIQLTSFIGREKEIAEVKRLLDAARLVTLTGSGGAGKTRLALQVAADILDRYPDGVWLVEFAPIADPAVVPKTVAVAVGVPEQPSRDMTETLIDTLRLKSLLLVLDNCEHLVAACADLAVALLRACPSVRLLATSREGLAVPGEILWRVPSLSLPEARRLPPPEDLVQYEAVRLFVERATATAPGFAITSQNAPAVAQVCQRLDGIPLAIELAAARVKVLAVEQIAARLDDQFRLLTGGSRTTVPRQQTLRVTMDWSYGLLSEHERTVLRRLSVFAGGWTLEAAEVICSDDGVGTSDILPLLTKLIDKSLVLADTRGSDARYSFLETVRQYALSRLTKTGEVTHLRERHRDFFLKLAEEAAPNLRGAEQGDWLDRLETDHDNFRTAMGWSLESPEAKKSLQLSLALFNFWRVRGYWKEGGDWVERALSQYADAPVAMRARALNDLGIIAEARGNPQRARTFFQQSLTLSRDSDDKAGIARALRRLGSLEYDHGRKQALLEESLGLSKQIGDKSATGSVLNYLGSIARRKGDYDRARKLHEESLALFKSISDQRSVAWTLNNLGHDDRHEGNAESAQAFYTQSLELYQQLGDKEGTARSLAGLAATQRVRNNYAEAAKLFKNSLALDGDLGHRLHIADDLENLAGLAAVQGHFVPAARLFGAAQGLLDDYSYQSLAVDRSREVSRSLAMVGVALGEEAYARLWAEGRAMMLEQAIEYALKDEER